MRARIGDSINKQTTALLLFVPWNFKEGSLVSESKWISVTRSVCCHKERRTNRKRWLSSLTGCFLPTSASQSPPFSKRDRPFPSQAWNTNPVLTSALFTTFHLQPGVLLTKTFPATANRYRILWRSDILQLAFILNMLPAYCWCHFFYCRYLTEER